MSYQKLAEAVVSAVLNAGHGTSGRLILERDLELELGNIQRMVRSDDPDLSTEEMIRRLRSYGSHV